MSNNIIVEPKITLLSFLILATSTMFAVAIVVSTGSREEMEHDVARLHEYGLWATLQRGDQAI